MAWSLSACCPRGDPWPPATVTSNWPHVEQGSAVVEISELWEQCTRWLSCWVVRRDLEEQLTTHVVMEYFFGELINTKFQHNWILAPTTLLMEPWSWARRELQNEHQFESERPILPLILKRLDPIWKTTNATLATKTWRQIRYFNVYCVMQIRAHGSQPLIGYLIED